MMDGYRILDKTMVAIMGGIVCLGAFATKKVIEHGNAKNQENIPKRAR